MYIYCNNVVICLIIKYALIAYFEPVILPYTGYTVVKKTDTDTCSWQARG